MDNRIFNELKSLYKTFNSIQINKTPTNESRIVLGNHNSNITYIFILKDTYPFTQPTMIIINNITTYDITYSSFLKINEKFTDILKNISGSDCLCCSSISCLNNWANSYQLIKLIDEFKQNLLIKKKILLIYLLNLIKNKYNITFNIIEDFILLN